MTRRKHRLTLAFLGHFVLPLTLVFGVIAWLLWPQPPKLTGLHPQSTEIGRVCAARLPKFQIVGAQDHTRERVCLWDPIVPLELPGKPAGRNFPNPPQLWYECAAASGCKVVRYDLGGQIAKGDPSEFHNPSIQFAYHVGRQTIGQNRLGRSPGCVIAWVLEGFRDVGIAFEDDPGMPPYTAETCRDWGNGKRPPQALFDLAKRRRIKSFARLESVEQVVDALVNGYAVHVGDQHWDRPRCRVVDGRQVADWHGGGGHALTIIGYDGTIPGKQYFYWDNSHGEDDVPAPLAGEPPGGFWTLRLKLEQAIFRQGGEAWVASWVEGFPSRELRPLYDFFGVE